MSRFARTRRRLLSLRGGQPLNLGLGVERAWYAMLLARGKADQGSRHPGFFLNLATPVVPKI